MAKKKTHKKKATTKKSTKRVVKHKHAPAKKSESASKASAPAKDDSLKNAAIVVLIVALIAVVVWQGTDSMPLSTSKTTTSANIASAGDFGVSEETKLAMKELADDDPFLGAEDAPVVIVEFSDFECPFCARFHEQTLTVLKEKFIETGVVKFVYRDLPLGFHANAQKAAEAAQCAHDQGKFWEYHDIIFANQRSLDLNSLKKYAADIGLDVTQFDECLSSDKYADEVREDAAAAAANGISGTPGFIINGQTLSGAQPYDRFEQVICSIVPESEPCANIAPPVELEVTILNDDACATCDTAQIRQVTQQLFPGATFKEVDAQSSEGQDLIEEHGLTYAPSYLFPNDVRTTKTWETNTQIRGAFVESGDGYRLRDEAVGATWFLSEEARQETMAAVNTALGKVDGDGLPQVDFFVMSYCPYGNTAEELLEPVYQELKGKAKFNPRYVIYNQGTGCYTDDDGTQLCSLHGQVELDQNMRELCVFHNYGEKEWFDFAIAMNKECDHNNANTCWEGVAADLGLDTDMISTCFDENKVKYAREHYELNQLLGVRGSPTLFFEGERYNGARTSNSYLATLCNGFGQDKPAECENVVAEPMPTSNHAAGGAGCGI